MNTVCAKNFFGNNSFLFVLNQLSNKKKKILVTIIIKVGNTDCRDVCSGENKSKERNKLFSITVV